jgi:hypothetical protein
MSDRPLQKTIQDSTEFRLEPSVQTPQDRRRHDRQRFAARAANENAEEDDDSDEYDSDDEDDGDEFDSEDDFDDEEWDTYPDPRDRLDDMSRRRTCGMISQQQG